MNHLLVEDFDYICNRDIEWNAFNGKTFLVTGATGLIGSLFIKAVLYASQKYDLDIKIIALIRDIKKAELIFGTDNPIKFIIIDLSNDKLVLEDNVDYILHAASVTSSKQMVTIPVDCIKTALNGTISVLDLAVEKKVSKVIYLSSMEVYGRMDVTDHLVTENELGYIDLSSVRSGYPEGKRMSECICNSYAFQYHLDVVSARLAQTFGPGVFQNENRVFAQFARSIIEGRDIVLNTYGKSEGNYVYTADAIYALLLLFTRSNAGCSYNIVNEDSHMTISQMAEFVASELSNGKIKVVYDISEKSGMYAADTKMHLSSSLLRSIGWQADHSLLDMYKRLIDYMIEMGF